MSKNTQDTSASHSSTPNHGAPTPFGDRSASHFTPRPHTRGTQEAQHSHHLDHDDYQHTEPAQPDYPGEVLEGDPAFASESEEAPVARGSWLMPTSSFLVLVAGVALAIADYLAPQTVLVVTEPLNAAGFTPGLVVALGTVLVVATRLLSRVHDLQRQLTDHADWVYDSAAATDETFDILIDSQEQVDHQRSGALEGLNQVADAIAQQDQKIAGLANTLRMYGKPLSEVSRHVTELSARSKATAAELESLTASLHGALEQTVQEVSGNIASLIEQAPTDKGAVAALEEARAVSGQLSQDIAQIMDAQAAHPEAEDIAGLRSEIDALQAAIRGLSSAEAAPNPEGSLTEESAPPPVMEADHNAPDAPTQTAAGSSQSSSEGVLGAIAKLKQMRP